MDRLVYSWCQTQQAVYIAPMTKASSRDRGCYSWKEECLRLLDWQSVREEDRHVADDASAGEMAKAGREPRVTHSMSIETDWIYIIYSFLCLSHRIVMLRCIQPCVCVSARARARRLKTNRICLHQKKWDDNRQFWLGDCALVYTARTRIKQMIVPPVTYTLYHRYVVVYYIFLQNQFYTNNLF